MTVLLVEQYLDFALRLAENYAIMAKGGVVAAGSRASASGDGPPAPGGLTRFNS